MSYDPKVPSSCDRKRARGIAFCGPDCRALASGVFAHVTLEAGARLPASDPAIIDVAILDMNHGWPNVGHEGVVAAFQDAACGLTDALANAGLSLRAISFDVRRALRLPAPDDRRFAIYVGTGGPGHLDPRLNDGRDENSQGIVEDPSWEGPLFRLFDAIGGREDAALLAVCHTFGLMCRWLDVADPVARGPEKGGKSEGVLANVLTEAGREHPLFAAFARRLGPSARLRVLDSRIYDLIPRPGAQRTVSIIGTETLGADGPPGDAMTMMEVARDVSGRMPRIFGVNHHPEIIDRATLMGMLRVKMERGEVDRAWYERRMSALSATFPDALSDGELHATSDFTFLGPLRFHVTRAARLRAESLGRAFGRHEEEVERALTEHLALP
jgi:hypothetical protein